MHEFMLNIDNKEILNEILHHSIDYMIGSWKDGTTLTKSSHKYGFSDPEEFESAIKMIADAYKLYCLNSLSEAQLLARFAHMNQEFQQSILNVFKARAGEVASYLMRECNSREHKLLESFDWDVRLIMGNSSLSSYRAQIARISFNCLEPDGTRSTMFFELDQKQLQNFIAVLEECDKKLNAGSKEEEKNEVDTKIEEEK